MRVYWWKETIETNPLSKLPDKETSKKLLLKMMARFRHSYLSTKAMPKTVMRCLGLYEIRTGIHSIRIHTQHLPIILMMRCQIRM